MDLTQQSFSDEDIRRQMVQRHHEFQNLQAMLLARQEASQAANVTACLPLQHDYLSNNPCFPVDTFHTGTVNSHGKRVATHDGFSMAQSSRNAAWDNEGLQATQCIRVKSQQNSPSASKFTGMSRSKSTRSAKSIPFVANGGPIAPLQASLSANPSLDRYHPRRSVDPCNTMFSTSLPRQSSTHHSPGLPIVEESQNLDIGMTPEVYLATHDELIPSPILVPPRPRAFVPTAYSNRLSSASYMTSTCPSMISAPSIADPVPLSRDNSSFDNGLSDAYSMIRIASSQSRVANATDDLWNEPQAFYGGKEEDVFPFPDATMSVPNSQEYLSSASATDNFLSHGSSGMERSVSATSATSTSSSIARRYKEAHYRHIQNGKNAPIARKPSPSVKSPAQPAVQSGKVPMPKTGSYTRPKHPRVFCKQCEEHPEGFRGEHELKRHTLAKHKGTVKKFVCRDPATVGLSSSVQAVNPLSKCKQCKAGKQYGAYYNAAAHLRRTHFKPKTSRGKGKRGDDEEKRGGKGGGDWPVMQELKLWFEEINVPVDANGGDDDDDAEAFDGNAPQMEEDVSFGMDMPFEDYPLMSGSGIDASTLDSTTAFMSATGLAPFSMSYDNADFDMNPPLNSMSSEMPYSTLSSTTSMTAVNFQTSFDDAYATF